MNMSMSMNMKIKMFLSIEGHKIIGLVLGLQPKHFFWMGFQFVTQKYTYFLSA